jgi:hypothetical protein
MSTLNTLVIHLGNRGHCAESHTTATSACPRPRTGRSRFVATGAAAQVAVLETVGAGVGKDERIEQVEKA